MITSWWLEYARARAIQALRALGLAPRPSLYVWDRVDEHRACWSAAAEAIGADFVDLGHAIWEVRRDGRRTRIANHLVQLDDPVILELAGDKEASYDLAKHAGVQVVDYLATDARDVPRAWRYVRELGVPVVVKPARGTSAGIGVSVGVRTRDELVRAMALAATRSRRVIVQRMAAGESYRLLFLDGKLIHAVRRRGIRVVGDGRSNIGQLLAAAAPDLPARDRTTQAFLAAARLDARAVPAAGQAVLVRPLAAGERRLAEVRTIYDEDVTPDIGNAVAEQAGRIVAALGSVWAGVDVVTKDASVDLATGDGGIMEINTTPGILHHCPSLGAACAVAVLVLERLLQGGP